MPFVPKSRKRKLAAEIGKPVGIPSLFECDNRGGLDIERLRSVLHPATPSPVFIREAGEDDKELVPASVLFPIVLRENGPFVLLTQRTENLKDHPGQISFPGGRVEPEDTSPAHTALRESEEEIGLASAHVEIVGYLPEYCTHTGYRVTPVVALVTPPFELSLDPQEVAGVFEVPLAFLMNPANHQQRTMHYRGRLRHYVAVPYGDHYIWGVTAGIIVTLFKALIAAETGR